MYLRVIIFSIFLTSCTDINIKDRRPCNCIFSIDTDLACETLDGGEQNEDAGN